MKYIFPLIILFVLLSNCSSIGQCNSPFLTPSNGVPFQQAIVFQNSQIKIEACYRWSHIINQTSFSPNDADQTEVEWLVTNLTADSLKFKFIKVITLQSGFVYRESFIAQTGGNGLIGLVPFGNTYTGLLPEGTSISSLSDVTERPSSHDLFSNNNKANTGSAAALCNCTGALKNISQFKIENLTIIDISQKNRVTEINTSSKSVGSTLTNMLDQNNNERNSREDDQRKQEYDKQVSSTANSSEYIPCNKCFGSGQISCPTCSGLGKVTCDKCNGTWKVSCTGCNGTGKVTVGQNTSNCSWCGGTGKVNCNCQFGKKECNACYGSGKINCDVCNGSGKVANPNYTSGADNGNINHSNNSSPSGTNNKVSNPSTLPAQSSDVLDTKNGFKTYKLGAPIASYKNAKKDRGVEYDEIGILKSFPKNGGPVPGYEIYEAKSKDSIASCPVKNIELTTCNDTIVKIVLLLERPQRSEVLQFLENNFGKCIICGSESNPYNDGIGLVYDYRWEWRGSNVILDFDGLNATNLMKVHENYRSKVYSPITITSNTMNEFQRNFFDRKKQLQKAKDQKGF